MTTKRNRPDKFTARKVVAVSLSIFWRRKFIFLSAVAIVMISADQFTGKIDDWFGPVPTSAKSYLGFVEFLLAYSILRGALTYAVYREMGGQPVSLRELSERLSPLAFSRSSLSPLSICFLYVVIPNVLLLGHYFGPDGVASVVFVAGILIWFWIHIVLYTVVPVAVNESVGVKDSIKRAVELSSGVRWAILRVILLVQSILQSLVAVLVIVTMLVFFNTGETLDYFEFPSLSDHPIHLLSIGLSVMFDSIISTVCYGYLKHGKFSNFCIDR